MRVIVLHADGLPAWALGAYGNEWIATPNLDEFAAQSVVFDQHFADVPSALSPTPTYSEIEWVDGPSLLPPWNVEIEPQDEDSPTPLPCPVPGILAPDDDETFERLRLTFGAVVEAFDAWFGNWWEAAQAADAMVLLISGRGQNLGEHGLVGEFRPWLHEELVHVPLIVHLPGGAEAGRRVPHLTQTVDLFPTILSALGLPPSTDGHGHDLLPLCRGGRPVRDYVVVSAAGGEEYALQTPHEKIIVPSVVPEGDPPRSSMYFVKPDDRWEVNDLHLPNLDYAEQLEKTLHGYLTACQQPGPLKAPPLPRWETANADRETGR